MSLQNRHARKPSVPISQVAISKEVVANNAENGKKDNSKLLLFYPEFKDVSGPLEYRCLEINNPLYGLYQAQADFSQLKQTAHTALMKPNSNRARMVGSQSLGPQIFYVRLTAPDTNWTQWEETGEVEMVHIQTQRICKAFYTTGVIRDTPGRSNRQGILVVQDVVITDRYAS